MIEAKAMTKQIITTPSGERMVVLDEAEYERLLDALEDAEDAAAVRGFEEKLASGKEELIPAEYMYRMLDGENQVAVWREFRGMTSKQLADAAGITQGYLSQIETSKRDGTIGTMKKIAEALAVSIDDLV
jgi:DNA-binding XRE family transcriptional regulator